jgi:hypothetical protein
MQTNEQLRIVDMARPVPQAQPTDLNAIKAVGAVVIVAVLACILLLVALLGIVVVFFGEEGARMLLVVVALVCVYWFVSRNQSQIRRENLHDLTRVQEVAVQAIIQHQRADDQGEVARMMPQVFKTLMDNQRNSQQLATQIAQHGRWLANNDAKAERTSKPAFPFEMGVDSDMEEMVEEMEELI